MIRYQHILAILDSSSSPRHILKKAIILANKTGAFLTVLNVDLTQQMKLTSFFTAGELSALPATHQELFSEYPEKGNEIEIKSCEASSIHKAVLKELAQYDYDLVVLNHKHHSPLLCELLVVDEWHLLRDSKVPVLFVDDADWCHRGQILTAINCDYEDLQHRKFNDFLLAETQKLAALLDNEVHLLNCYLGEKVDMSFRPREKDLQGQADKQEEQSHWLKLLQAAEPYRLDKQQLHLAQGLPEHVIPELAGKLEINLLIMGAAEHRHAFSFLQGHTANQVLNQLRCDVLVLKPNPDTQAEVRL
jgi:universal stress protein E